MAPPSSATKLGWDFFAVRAAFFDFGLLALLVEDLVVARVAPFLTDGLAVVRLLPFAVVGFLTVFALVVFLAAVLAGVFFFVVLAAVVERFLAMRVLQRTDLTLSGAGSRSS